MFGVWGGPPRTHPYGSPRGRRRGISLPCAALRGRRVWALCIGCTHCATRSSYSRRPCRGMEPSAWPFFCVLFSPFWSFFAPKRHSRVGALPVPRALLPSASAGEAASVASSGTAAAAEPPASHRAWGSSGSGFGVKKAGFGARRRRARGIWGSPPLPRPPRPPPPPRLKSARRVAKETLMGLPENSLPKKGGFQPKMSAKGWRGGGWRGRGGRTVKPIDGGFGGGGVVKGHGGFALQLAGLAVRVQVDHGLPCLLIGLRRGTC